MLYQAQGVIWITLTMEKVIIKLGSRRLVERRDFVDAVIMIILQIAFTWFNTDLPVTFNT